MINWATTILSVITVVIIFSVKKFINEKYKKKLIVPIPIELIVVNLNQLFLIPNNILIFCLKRLLLLL